MCIRDRAAGTSDVSGQVAGTVVLPADANAVSIVSDGFVFKIDDTTKTATLVGSAATPPKGDLLVPASITSGTSTYEVTSIAKDAFAKCSELTSVSLPATLREVDPDAVAGCSSLKSIAVSAKMCIRDSPSAARPAARVSLRARSQRLAPHRCHCR